MDMYIAIRTFIAEKVENIAGLCFFLANKIDKRYAFNELSPGKLKDQSREIVQIAERNHETDKLAFYLWQYWVEDYKGSPQVLIDTGLVNELCLAAQTLWSRDRTLGEQAFEYLSEIKPAFKEVWQPANAAAVTFDPTRPLEALIAQLGQCEALYQQAWEAIQQHQWQTARDLFTQLYALQPGYGKIRWQPDQLQHFASLQKAWEAASSGFVYDEVLPPGRKFPYALFQEMKKAITPNSTMDEVQAELRQIKDLTEATRASLESLGKNEEERLFVDMLIYPHCPTPENALAIERAFLESGRLPPPDEIVAQYPAAAGELLVILGYPDQAAAFWMAAQCTSPLDGRLAHSLGLLYLGLSQNSANGAVENWQRAIAQWALALSDTTYWVAWGRKRFEAYGRSFVFTTVLNLLPRVPDYLIKSLESMPRQAGLDEKAFGLSALKSDLSVEFAAVRLMQAVGNIPLASGRLARFGPLWMSHFGAQINAKAALATYMRDVQLASIQPNALTGALRPEEILQRLRWLFSDFSRAASQLEIDPALALETLRPQPDPTSCKQTDCPRHGQDWPVQVPCVYTSDFSAKNPAYELLPDQGARLCEDALQLAIYAHFRLIAREIAQASGTTVGAFESEWQVVAELLEKSAERDQSQARLRRFLEDASRPSQASPERLNAVIALLEAYLSVAMNAQILAEVFGLNEPLLKNRLANWLKLRASNRLEQADIPAAEADLKRALEYNPYDHESRALLATTWCNLTSGISDRRLILDYLWRAKRLILEGQKISPGFSFDVWLEQIEKLLQRFAYDNPPPPIFPPPPEGPITPDEQTLTPPPMPDDDNIPESLRLFRQATQELLSGQLSESLHTFDNALKLSPDDPEIQSGISEALIALAVRYVETGKTGEAKALLSEWRKRLPRHQERLERRGQFLNVWPKLKSWLREYPQVIYDLRDYEYLEFPLDPDKVPPLVIIARIEKGDLRLSAPLPFISAADEEIVLSNLLQAARLLPIFKVTSSKRLDYFLLGQVPIEMLEAKWFVFLLYELYQFANISSADLLKLDSLQAGFRENHQRLTQGIESQDFLSTSSKAVERLCNERQLGFERLTEARFFITTAFGQVTMDAQKDYVRFSTPLREIELHHHPNRLASLRKLAELNDHLQWCKLCLSEKQQVILSLELPYVEFETTERAFELLEQTYRSVNSTLTEDKG